MGWKTKGSWWWFPAQFPAASKGFSPLKKLSTLLLRHTQSPSQSVTGSLLLGGKVAGPWTYFLLVQRSRLNAAINQLPHVISWREKEKHYWNILFLIRLSTSALPVAGRMAQSGAAPLFLLLLYYCKATAVYQDTSESEYITWRTVQFTDSSKIFEKKRSVIDCLNR